MTKNKPLYTGKEIQQMLGSALGKPVHHDTYGRWKRILGVRPDVVHGRYLYTRGDLDALLLLARWFGTGGTLVGFKAKYGLE